MNRCKKHRSIAPHNMNADDGAQECGACIMYDVFLCDRSRLEILDGYANLLRHHAEIRVALAEARRRLEFYEGAAPAKES